jgi:hypothetical protein
MLGIILGTALASFGQDIYRMSENETYVSSREILTSPNIAQAIKFTLVKGVNYKLKFSSETAIVISYSGIIMEIEELKEIKIKGEGQELTIWIKSKENKKNKTVIGLFWEGVE